MTLQFASASDPTLAGWAFTSANSATGGAASVSPPRGPDYALPQGARWSSPAVPCAANPWQFYRLAFRTRTDALSHYAVFYQDRNGAALVADNAFEHALLSPAAVTVHDDRQVNGQFIGVKRLHQTSRTSFSL